MMQQTDEVRHRNGPDARRVTGMLMEEVVLYLLETAGYKTIATVDGDPTLY